MKLERLLKLAGVELSEASLAKYNEPKANHAKKSFASDEAHAKGHDNPKDLEGEGKKTKLSKYDEPKANHAKKSFASDEAHAKGHDNPKDLEGEGKVPGSGIYKDHNSTK